MSIELINRVWPLKLAPTEKLVLLALADQVFSENNADNECFMLVSTICTKCGLTRATVFRALHELELAGHLTRLQRPGRSTVFRIHPSQSATGGGMRPVADCDPSQSATSLNERTDPSRIATDPSHSETNPSQSATHIRVLSGSLPASQAGEARAPDVVSHETVHVDGIDLSPDVANAFASVCEGWKLVEGLNIVELGRFFDFVESQSQGRSRKYRSSETQLELAGWLAAQGDGAVQAEVVSQSIRAGHCTLYALKDRPSKQAADTARKRSDALRDMQAWKTRARVVGCRMPRPNEEPRDYGFEVERAEREAADRKYRESVAKRGKGPQHAGKLLAERADA